MKSLIVDAQACNRCSGEVGAHSGICFDCGYEDDSPGWKFFWIVGIIGALWLWGALR